MGKLYYRSTRDGITIYSMTQGMDDPTVRNLMADLGHTDITAITEDEYNANK